MGGHFHFFSCRAAPTDPACSGEHVASFGPSSISSLIVGPYKLVLCVVEIRGRVCHREERFQVDGRRQNRLPASDSPSGSSHRKRKKKWIGGSGLAGAGYPPGVHTNVRKMRPRSISSLPLRRRSMPISQGPGSKSGVQLRDEHHRSTTTALATTLQFLVLHRWSCRDQSLYPQNKL
jgi:hypothetical protein